MKLFEKNIFSRPVFQSFTIYTKSSNLDVWLRSEFASGTINYFRKRLHLNVWKHLRTTASANSWAAVFQESLALPLKQNALTSGFCNLGELVWGHRFKLEAEDFIDHILQRSFPNFGLKILILCSARSLRSFYFSLFCSQLVYTCSKFG